MSGDFSGAIKMNLGLKSPRKNAARFCGGDLELTQIVTTARISTQISKSHGVWHMVGVTWHRRHGTWQDYFANGGRGSIKEVLHHFRLVTVNGDENMDKIISSHLVMVIMS